MPDLNDLALIRVFRRDNLCARLRSDCGVRGRRGRARAVTRARTRDPRGSGRGGAASRAGWLLVVGAAVLPVLLACTASRYRAPARPAASDAGNEVAPALPSSVLAARSPSTAPSASAVSAGDGACALLMRPGCVPRSHHSGTADHFVPLECSTLFEVGPRIALPGAPLPLGPGLALVGPLERDSPRPGAWLTLRYGSVASRTDRLQLEPAPEQVLRIARDPRRPVLLGRTRCGAQPCSGLGLWLLRCDGRCEQERYAALDAPAALDAVPALEPRQRTELARAIEAEREAERRERCRRSSVGCRDELTVGGAAAPAPPAEAGWLLPGGAVRLELERGPGGIALTRRSGEGVLLDRWLLLSAERALHVNAPRLAEPERIEDGYLALLTWDGPAVYGAVLRLDGEGRLLGAPVRAATLAQGLWFGGCSADACLVAVADGTSVFGHVLRLTASEAPPCESQEAVESRGGFSSLGDGEGHVHP